MAAVPYSTLRAVARTRISFTSRRMVEDHIDQMIALLDRLDGDPELEPDNDDEPQGDDEPSLGWLGQINQARIFAGGIQCGQGGLEYDVEHDMADDEPSLAASSGTSPWVPALGFWKVIPHWWSGDTAVFNSQGDFERSRITCQAHWADGALADCEGDEHDGSEPDVDGEPWLGWTAHEATLDATWQPGACWTAMDGEDEHDGREPDETALIP